MQYVAHSIPTVRPGTSFKGIKTQTVPDQSMSLQEILERFTRNETLPVGHDHHYDEETEHDLEKVKHFDLVEKQELAQEFKDKASKIDATLKKREAKEKAEKAAKEAEEQEFREAFKKQKAEQNSAKSA